MKTITVLFLTWNIIEIYGHKTVQQLIPNGAVVPDPCSSEKSNTPGHYIMAYGIEIRGNPFLEDFNSRTKWSKDLCMKDSDNDGRSNGEELGDTLCVWKNGDMPSRSENITHPGVCEPMDSLPCKEQNAWLQCENTENECKAINEKDVIKTVLRFPETEIPTKRTSYHCMIFDLPGNDTYHLIGTRPAIDNAKITHHILLFGCDEREGTVMSSDSPYKCGMQAHPQCINIIGTWTIGSEGDCFHENMGFQIGLKGFRRAALQVHWNNPPRTANLTDSSGIELYYTKNRRKYDAGMFAVGQENLLIPPGVRDMSFSSTCSSDCINVMFPNSVYITRAVNHMHHAGKQQTISIYRDGTKIRDITNDRHYNYNMPVFYKFDPPIQLNPGDEIKTKCSYSNNSNKTITFGAGTSDEMCYGFITYYPVQDIALPYCTTWKTVEKCKRYLPAFKGIVDGCNWKDFLSSQNEYFGLMMIELAMHCNSKCSVNCTETIKDLRKHECLKGDLGDFIIQKLELRHRHDNSKFLLRMMRTCFKGEENSSSKLQPLIITLMILLGVQYIFSK